MVHMHSFWLSKWNNYWCWCLWWSVCCVVWISSVHLSLYCPSCCGYYQQWQQHSV